MQRRLNDSPCSGVRCGIVLSAGNGTRMREFVYRSRGDYLPKQYINFIGKRSMLEHTFQRAEKLIPAQRLFTVVAREHLKFNEVRRQIAWRPQQTIVIQPRNKDTAPGILLPVAYLYKQHPDAAVVIFPSDHFVLEEDLFMRHVDLAFRLVEAERSRMVLLGVEPECADPEYGYIVPRQDIGGSDLGSARIVEAFVEKPSPEIVKKISKEGALWNTLVIVVRAKTLLEVFQRTTAELYYSFQPVLNAIGTPDEQHVIEQVYQELAPVNFSKAVLEALPVEQRRALLVLPVRGVTWSDWGASDRLLNTLRRMGKPGYPEQSGIFLRRETSRLSPRKNVGMLVKRIQDASRN